MLQTWDNESEDDTAIGLDLFPGPSPASVTNGVRVTVTTTLWQAQPLLGSRIYSTCSAAKFLAAMQLRCSYFPEAKDFTLDWPAICMYSWP